jgi:GGDEF domain-containing protein
MFPILTKKTTSYKQLKYLAYHDTLTGLFNRNWLHDNIDNINHKYIFFIDINNLKDVNKNGHTIGDEHIKAIVKSIKVMLSTKDIFLRYAGDEFIVFSNSKDCLTTNTFYAVGTSNLSYDKIKSIINADKNMILNKTKIKKDLS